MRERSAALYIIRPLVHQIYNQTPCPSKSVLSTQADSGSPPSLPHRIVVSIKQREGELRPLLRPHWGQKLSRKEGSKTKDASLSAQPLVSFVYRLLRLHDGWFI